MSMGTPAQSLTSVGWYQRALDEAANGRRKRVMRWFRGRSFLMFHVSLYAVGIVALFAVDLIRAPESLWIGTVALAWAVLIVIHAAIAGLVWATGLLRDDTSNEAAAPGWLSAGWREDRGEPQDANFRMAAAAAQLPPTASEQPLPLAVTQTWAAPQPIQQAPPPAATKRPEPAIAPGSGLGETPLSPWGGWEPKSAAEIARTATSSNHSSERASWTEASAVAWLSHASDAGPSRTPPSPAEDVDSDVRKEQRRSRLRARYAAHDDAGSADENPVGTPRS